MTDNGNVDRDAVIRAQVLLLGSGIGIHQQIAAYRVLAQVSPAVYLPKLARALLTVAHREVQDRPEVQLAVVTDAVDAARRLDPAEPQRGELLIRALDYQQYALYRQGLRAEGLAVREEMARIGTVDRYAESPEDFREFIDRRTP